jgi:hypothetical protein
VVARAIYGDPRKRAVSVVPLQSGLSVTVRRYVWLAVMGAWVVLAATCLTLGILLLTWSHSRRLDAGVRLALGASPRRLVTTALLESALLASAGAAIGWLGYTWTRGLFFNAMPHGLQSFAAETADGRLIAMTCGTALISAVVAGTLPAVRTSRVNPLDAFRPTRGSTIDRLVGGPVLLSVQATFGMLLLVGAVAVVPGVIGFLLRPPGFEPADLFVLGVPTSSGPDARNAIEQTRRGHTVMEIARQLPGVASVALSKDSLFRNLASDLFSRRLAPQGFNGRVQAVGAEFFDTLAVPTIAGRTYSKNEIDRQALVVILDESGARTFWPDLPAGDVIGRSVTTSDGPRIVVGVTADMRTAPCGALPGRPRGAAATGFARTRARAAALGPTVGANGRTAAPRVGGDEGRRPHPPGRFSLRLRLDRGAATAAFARVGGRSPGAGPVPRGQTL